jgi:CubicO group peptidase (beta-lactamase class C family)
VKPATVELFTRAGPGNRALGRKMRDTTSTGNTGSLLLSWTSGHRGFTGTSIWIDPTTHMFVVFLTNRVFAPRTRRAISRLKDLRGTLADGAVRLREHSCRILAIAGRDDTCE